MKKFVSGILAGALLTGSVSFAAYAVEKASFKVMVNGKEFNSSPAVVIDGSAYLPLRAIGEALGVAVNWNEGLRQVEMGNSAPVAEENQYSRTNPAPMNTVQTYSKNDDWFEEDNYSAAIRVIEVIRGDKAWEIIKQDNMFNSEPRDGYEYVIAKVAFSLLSKKEDGTVSASKYDFEFYSSNNEEYESASVVKENSLDKQLFPGGNAEGYVVGMVKKDDAAPKLVYGLEYDGTGGIWFGLK